MQDKLKVLKKLDQAREIIRTSPVKKLGRNTYSNYDYYTPEQVSTLTSSAAKEVGIINIFGTYYNEYGLNAKLDIVDLDSGETITFTQVTAIPEIKATNVAQQLGGMNTYSNRYLLMFAYDIVDNNLDPDTTENTKRTVEQKKTASKPKSKTDTDERVVLTEEHPKWNELVKYIQSGGTIENIRKRYKMSKAIESELNKQAGVNG